MKMIERMTIYLPPNRSFQDNMIHTCIHDQDDLVDVQVEPNVRPKNLGPCDLYFMVQVNCLISFTLWDVRRRYSVLMSQ